MGIKQQLMNCLKEKNPMGLAELLGNKGFNIEIDIQEALGPRTERLKAVYLDVSKIRSKVVGHNLNTLNCFYEDLNYHVPTYLKGFVKQRRSNGRVKQQGMVLSIGSLIYQELLNIGDVKAPFFLNFLTPHT